MNDAEREVREAARASHDANERVRFLSLANTPADPDERRAAREALEVARAEAMRAYNRLDRAKSKYAGQTEAGRKK